MCEWRWARHLWAVLATIVLTLAVVAPDLPVATGTDAARVAGGSEMQATYFVHARLAALHRKGNVKLHKHGTKHHTHGTKHHKSRLKSHRHRTQAPRAWNSD